MDGLKGLGQGDPRCSPAGTGRNEESRRQTRVQGPGGPFDARHGVQHAQAGGPDGAVEYVQVALLKRYDDVLVVAAHGHRSGEFKHKIAFGRGRGVESPLDPVLLDVEFYPAREFHRIAPSRRGKHVFEDIAGHRVDDIELPAPRTHTGTSGQHHRT